MDGYALFLASVGHDELDPSQSVDGEVVHGAAWQRITPEHPIGPLSPRFWAPIADLFGALLEEASP